MGQQRAVLGSLDEVDAQHVTPDESVLPVIDDQAARVVLFVVLYRDCPFGAGDRLRHRLDTAAIGKERAVPRAVIEHRHDDLGIRPTALDHLQQPLEGDQLAEHLLEGLARPGSARSRVRARPGSRCCAG